MIIKLNNRQRVFRIIIILPWWMTGRRHFGSTRSTRGEYFSNSYGCFCSCLLLLWEHKKSQNSTAIFVSHCKGEELPNNWLTFKVPRRRRLSLLRLARQEEYRPQSCFMSHIVWQSQFVIFYGFITWPSHRQGPYNYIPTNYWKSVPQRKSQYYYNKIEDLRGSRI